MSKSFSVSLTEARRIAGKLVKLLAAGAIQDAQDPEASFYANLVRGFEASLVAVRSYPDYATTSSFNRRITWNPKSDHWEDTSELDLNATRQRCQARPFPEEPEAASDREARPRIIFRLARGREPGWLG